MGKEKEHIIYANNNESIPMVIFITNPIWSLIVLSPLVKADVQSSYGLLKDTNHQPNTTNTKMV